MNVSPLPFPSFTHAALGLHELRAQKVLGWLAMCLMLTAFLSLVDGLTAEMQRGPNRIDMMAGSETPLSGPIPVKKAELSDFSVQGNAPDGQVRLVLDDFFASYWFGSGMWRGRLVVGDNPGIGEYHMVVEFRDAPPKGAQNYRVVVWADESSMRQGSYSWVTRTFGHSPFSTAAYLFPAGLLLCGINFLLGRKRAQRIQAAGCGEVYKVMRGEGSSEKAKAVGRGKQEASFSLGEVHGMALGRRCLVMRPDGSPVMEIAIAFCDVRHSSFLLNGDEDVRAGDVVFPLPTNMANPVRNTTDDNKGRAEAQEGNAQGATQTAAQTATPPATPPVASPVSSPVSSPISSLGGVPFTPFRPSPMGRATGTAATAGTAATTGTEGMADTAQKQNVNPPSGTTSEK